MPDTYILTNIGKHGSVFIHLYDSLMGEKMIPISFTLCSSFLSEFEHLLRSLKCVYIFCVLSLHGLFLLDIY